MAGFSRRPIRGDVTGENAEIVRHAGAGGITTALVSALALIFSAVSLYETVLRQPELAVYVPPVIHYTRESGGEVFALPITIANSGARDGTVLSMELTATAPDRAEPKTFYSAYSVGAGYFLAAKTVRSLTGGLTTSKERPKTPFAPLSIAGRTNFSGTILFFGKGKEVPYLVHEAGEFALTLKLNTRFDDRLAWLDQVLAKPPKPMTFRLKLKRFDQFAVRRGDTIVMKSADW